MPLTLDQLAQEAMQFPASSRALLAERMVESLDADERDEVERAWAAEAVRRRDEVRSGRVQPIRERLERAALSARGSKTR